VISGQRRDSRRHRDSKRFKDQKWRAWYSLAIWRGKNGLRAQQLARQALCERHLKLGQDEPADTVNHRKPHEGDWALFIDPNNHESVCKACHDIVIQAEEVRGYAVGCDIKGRPLAADHPWNAKRKAEKI
jgi:5-methylcytosine-specific restriction protein A